MVELGVVQAVQEMDRARAGGGEAHADLARPFRVRAGHERRHLFVAHLDELDPVREFLQCADDRVDPVARIPVDPAHTVLVQPLEQKLCRRHTHRSPSQLVSEYDEIVAAGSAAQTSRRRAWALRPGRSGGTHVHALAVAPCRLRISTGWSSAGPNQCGSRVSNSATSPGPMRDVVVAEDQPHLSRQHVEPLVALVGAELGLVALRRDDHLPRMQPARLAASAGRPCARCALRGLSRMRGSPTSGAPTSSSSGTRCAWASGSSSSRLGLRWPVSSRDSVLLEIPVAAASSVRVTPRCGAQPLQARRRPRRARSRSPARSPSSHASCAIPGNSNECWRNRHGARAVVGAWTTNSYDVVVVGGGAAGLSAALVLGRARRRVAVIDAGAPRNAPAAHMQGFLSRDGMPPVELLAAGRAEVARLRRRARSRTRSLRSSPASPSASPTAATLERAPDPRRDRRARRAARHPRRPRALGPRSPALPLLPRLGGPRPAARRARHRARLGPARAPDRGSGRTTSSSSRTPYELTERRSATSSDARGIADRRRRGRAARRRRRPPDRRRADGRSRRRAHSGVHPAAQRPACRRAARRSRLRGRRGRLRRSSTPPAARARAGVWAAGNVADPRAQVITAAGDGSAAAIAINADLVDEDVATQPHNPARSTHDRHHPALSASHRRASTSSR